MADNRTETLVSTKNRKEAEEVLEFLSTLTQGERKEFLGYVRGAKLVKEYSQKHPQTA